MSISDSTPRADEPIVKAKLPNGHLDQGSDLNVAAVAAGELREHAQNGVVSPDGIATETNGTDVNAVETSVAGLSLETPEADGQNNGSLSTGSTGSPSDLHQACATGQLDLVRSLLSQSLEPLETLDVTTGCTPIVLAVRNNHPDVVRELLSAGAIVPPPGVTNDGYMMSILYPGMIIGGMYGMPGMNGGGHLGGPAGSGAAGAYGQPQMGAGPDYYGYYPPQDGFKRSPGGGVGGGGAGAGPGASPHGHHPHHPHAANGGSPVGNGSANANGNANGVGHLPPADVAKTIPCRNFPNCKYGSACVFFHPSSGPTAGLGGPSGLGSRPMPFFPQHQMQTMNGFEGYGGMQQAYGYAPEYQQQQQQQHQHRFQAGNMQPHDPLSQAQPSSIVNNEEESETLDSATPAGNAATDGEASNSTSSPPSVEQTEGQNASRVAAAQEESPSSSSPVNPDASNHQPIQLHLQPPHPNGAPIFIPGGMTSPQQPHPYGMSLSPLSPSMLSGSLPSIPPADQFFAAGSPPPSSNFAPGAYGQPFQIPNGNYAAGPGRRQSFGQPQFAGKAFGGHGKKPSFSGGPRPFRGPGAGPNSGPAPNMGTWKDGNPPPCAFFAQGKCRNGELCKFPHLDEQGNDCRHPDVIRGIIPPLPPLSRQRGMRSGGTMSFSAPFDPALRQQQQLNFMHQQQIHPMHQQVSPHPAHRQSLPASLAQVAENGQSVPNGPAPPAITGESSSIQSVSADGPVTQTTTITSNLTSSLTTPDLSNNETSIIEKNPSLPAKPVGSPMPSIIRSASQPGVQRVHVSVSGFNSRSHSPAPSNVSFHGNGHPRRNGGRAPLGGAAAVGAGAGGPGRSTSGDRKMPVGSAANHHQRVPQADEFPALGGGAGSTNQTGSVSGSKSTPHTGANNSPAVDTGNWSKTAAQVLSMPAPPRIEKEKQAPEENVTMEEDPETGAVIISREDLPSALKEAERTESEDSTPKASASATAAATSTTSPTKRPSVSFASVIATSQVESSPVGIKA
ncbi:hypothetical protein BD324DRAFT_258741 [Kockovaella imperatae]|uniref:C3H1-type domain-containing protein n=1 Tax=Kockovaella imperatae TaxID=4999 RepID=A0A1Y1UQ14_9TREE|nr:hypothetical protein BD324DRAFT_258741 [Kockovaella imperatae]ORX40113.1 hypothetical protein BD324DRAFT_258741 [Kockovaella imperatae]